MGRKPKAIFNHKESSLGAASGVDIDDMQTRMDSLVDGLNKDKVKTASVIAERLENSFSKRELAVIQASDMMNMSADPFAQLIASMTGE